MSGVLQLNVEELNELLNDLQELKKYRLLFGDRFRLGRGTLNCIRCLARHPNLTVIGHQKDDEKPVFQRLKLKSKL